MNNIVRYWGPEYEVDQLGKQVKLRLTLEQAIGLLNSGEYESAIGLNPLAEHYRKRRGATGCYHLEITGADATLHWEDFDPRRYPVEHVQETPKLIVLVSVAAGAVVAVLGLSVFALARAFKNRKR